MPFNPIGDRTFNTARKLSREPLCVGTEQAQAVPSIPRFIGLRERQGTVRQPACDTNVQKGFHGHGSGLLQQRYPDAAA